MNPILWDDSTRQRPSVDQNATEPLRIAVFFQDHPRNLTGWTDFELTLRPSEIIVADLFRLGLELVQPLITREAWHAGTAHQLEALLTPAHTGVQLNASRAGLWAVLTARDPAGVNVTLGKGTFFIVRDNAEPGSAVHGVTYATLSSIAAGDQINAAAIAQEATRAIAAEGGLANAIAAEGNARATADTTNANAIAAEATRAAAAEGSLAADITAEATARSAADTTNANAITQEVTRATGAETSLAADITAEANARSAANTTNANAITAEKTRAETAEATLAGNIAGEATARAAADSINATAITAETTRATTAEADLAGNIIAEAGARTAADTTNANAIVAETTRATTAEATLTGNLAAEITRATNADTTHTTAIAAEAARAATAETGLAGDITAEAGIRAAGDTANASAIGAEITRATNAEAALTALVAARVTIASIVDAFDSTSTVAPLSANKGRELHAAIQNILTILTSDDGTLDTLQEIVEYIKLNREDLEALNITAIAGLQTALDSLGTAITTNASAIATESTRAKAAEIALAEDITAETTRATSAETTIAGTVTVEANARVIADTTNANAIAAETTRATNAETAIAGTVTAEANTRATADSTNATAISVEVNRATAAEGALANAINAEATARSAADTANANAIVAEKTRAEAIEASIAGNLTAEASTRATADTTNATAITAEVNRATAAEGGLANAISTEAGTRATADTANANAISAEVTRATTAESTIAGTVTAEATTRAAAIAAEATTRAAAIDAEATARATAITAETTTRAAAIDAEATTRATAVAELTAATAIRIEEMIELMEPPVATITSIRIVGSPWDGAVLTPAFPFEHGEAYSNTDGRQPFTIGGTWEGGNNYDGALHYASFANEWQLTGSFGEGYTGYYSSGSADLTPGNANAWDWTPGDGLSDEISFVFTYVTDAPGVAGQRYRVPVGGGLFEHYEKQTDNSILLVGTYEADGTLVTRHITLRGVGPEMWDELIPKKHEAVVPAGAVGALVIGDGETPMSALPWLGSVTIECDAEWIADNSGSNGYNIFRSLAPITTYHIQAPLVGSAMYERYPAGHIVMIEYKVTTATAAYFYCYPTQGTLSLAAGFGGEGSALKNDGDHLMLMGRGEDLSPLLLAFTARETGIA